MTRCIMTKIKGVYMMPFLFAVTLTNNI